MSTKLIFQTITMMVLKTFLALPLLYQTAFSLTAPSRATSKFDIVSLAALAPPSTPVSDWQQDGEAAE